MSLQEKLDAQKQKLGSAASKEALEVMHRATEDLENSRIADKAKGVKTKKVNFSARDRRPPSAKRRL